jgi:preprotein translocase subunit SecG
MKNVLIIFLLLSNFAYNQDSESEYLRLNIELLKTQKQFILLDKKIEDLSASMSTQSKSISALVDKNDKALRAEVTSIYDSLQKNSLRVTANDSKIKLEQAKSEKNFLYSIIGILVLLFLLVGIYILNQKRAKSLEVKTGNLDASTQNLKDQLAELSTSTSEDIASALEKFASIILAQPKTDSVPDHSMVFEFAKQIVSMENNLSRMDTEVRGLNRITRAIENMHNTLKTMNYEIVPLLGSNLIEGQIIEIGLSEPDVSIEAGKKIIYNVVKAEILFNGKQIQRAKVDIKYNPND